MKKTIIFFVAFFLLSVTAVSAQTAWSASDIAGKWKIADTCVAKFVGAQIDAQIKAGMDESTANGRRDGFIQMAKTFTYEYLPDGKLITNQGRAPVEGVWKLSDDKQALVISTAAGERSRKIIAATKSSLTLFDAGFNVAITFVPVQ